MTVARAGVGFVVATIGADRATKGVAFSRGSLSVVVTANAGVNLVTSVSASGIYGDSIVGVNSVRIY